MTEEAAVAEPERAGISQPLHRRLIMRLRQERSFLLALAFVPIVYGLAQSPIGKPGHFGPLTGLLFVALFGVILYAGTGVVHHAETLASKLGEPYGTLVLTLTSVTVECVMIITMMAHGDTDPDLARNTIYATLMILINGVVGVCFLVGGYHRGEQFFNLKGGRSYLLMTITLVGTLLILPLLLSESDMRRYGAVQVCISLLSYPFFLFIQTGRHSGFFQSNQEAHDESEPASVSLRYHTVMLVALVVTIAILVESLSITTDDLLSQFGWPQTLAALMVAIIIVGPEGITAVRAALADDQQRSINVAMGSALSTVALTVPVVLIASHVFNYQVIMHLTPIQSALVIITLLAAMVNLTDCESNMLEGFVQLMLFCTFVILFLAF